MDSFQGFYIDFKNHLFFENHSEVTLFFINKQQNETIYRPSKTIRKKVSLRIIILYKSQVLFILNFSPLVSSNFNITKLKYCIKNMYQFYSFIFHKFMLFIT